MVEPHYLGAIELGDQIAAYRISSVEVTQHLIARIEARDAEINAVVVHDFDRALIAAAEADARIAAGDRLPLLGVPMLAKESFDLALVPDLMEQSRVYQHLISAFAGSFMPEPAYQLVVAQAAELDLEDESFRAARTRGTVSGHRDWQAVNGRRHALAVQWARLFESFDVVIKPPFPTAAFSHDQVSPKELRQIDVDGSLYDYLDLYGYAGIATAPGLPATVIPIGTTSAGLPIGIEIVGPFLEDLTTLRFAQAVEREFGGFFPPPGW